MIGSERADFLQRVGGFSEQGPGNNEMEQTGQYLSNEDLRQGKDKRQPL